MRRVRMAASEIRTIRDPVSAVVTRITGRATVASGSVGSPVLV